MNKGRVFSEQAAKILAVWILLSLNITKVIYFTETLRFNAAISDVFLPIAAVILLAFSVKKGLRATFPYLGVWIALAGWIVLTGLLAIQNTAIVDSGLSGLVSELIKTLICIAYFYIGYHTFKILSFDGFRRTWMAAALLFVFGGFVIYIAAQQGILFMGDNPNYFTYYMGTDTDPNHAATYLSITAFAMGAFLFFVPGRKSKIAIGSVLFFAVVGLFATGSRGGMIGFAAGAFFLGCIYLFSGKRRVMTAILIVLIALLGFMQFDHLILDDQLMTHTLYKFKNFDDGLEERMNLGKAALLMGLDHPIFGVGRGNYEINKATYFEAMGAEEKGDIAHNTYAGIFAETGVVGLVLFFAPLWLMFLAAYRRYQSDPVHFKEMKMIWAWVAAAVLATGVQALVLNVENRRFLWYLSGVMIGYFESGLSVEAILFAGSSADENKSKRQLRRLNALLALLLGALFLFSVWTLSVPMRLEQYNTSQTVELPVETEAGVPVTYAYTLNLRQNDAKTERLAVSIIEETQAGETITLDTYRYTGANGTIQRTVVPAADGSKLSVRYQKVDNTASYNMMPMWVAEETEVLALNKWWYLQPAPAKAVLQRLNWYSEEAYVQKTALTPAIGTVFGDSIELTGITAVPIEAGVEVTFEFKCLKPVDENYNFVFFGYPDNLHLLEESRLSSGYTWFTLKSNENTQTENWISNENYTLAYIIPYNQGVFRLRGYFYYKDGNDTVQRIYLSDGKTYAPELGWLNIDQLMKEAEK